MNNNVKIIKSSIGYQIFCESSNRPYSKITENNEYVPVNYVNIKSAEKVCNENEYTITEIPKESMTIEMIKEIFDENEKVAIVDFNGSEDKILYKGYFHNIPKNMMQLPIKVSLAKRLGDYLGLFIELWDYEDILKED